MKRVIQWLQNLRLARIFTVFLACLLISLVQACSRPEITTQLNQPPTQLPIQNTELGKEIRQMGENIGSSTEEVTKRLTKGTERAVEDLKENVKNVTREAAKNLQ